MAFPNFVKFQRGSLNAYNALLAKDQDTLYFIFDPVDQSKGSLYLGDKLISSNVGGSGASSLAELTDVVIDGAHTGDFLVKSSSGTWAAVGATAVAELIINTGALNVASLDIDEDVFQFNAVDGKLELKGFASATAVIEASKEPTLELKSIGAACHKRPFSPFIRYRCFSFKNFNKFVRNIIKEC